MLPKIRTKASARRTTGSGAKDDIKQAIEIFTDGACRGNPGPGGWGALLRFGKHDKHLYGAEAETTNNRMELMADYSGA